ncbi:MAG: DNA-protecting protein DprA, partial [Firmicutes bacterium]|nr:DNA-protecting protein DprA [Bacillota bacterium]
VYPPENIGLYKAISERGTIISEYPPGTLPAAGNFPARNRIISGLSHGTLVIEAGLKSGALITVDCALEQGREVYALPGNISSQFSTGTNKLLKEGAKLITSVEDILEDLNITNCFGAAKPTNRAIVLDFFETEVYNALEDGEKGVEELIQKTGIDIGRLNAVLTIMEIKGIIKQIPGKIFMKQWNS